MHGGKDPLKDQQQPSPMAMYIAEYMEDQIKQADLQVSDAKRAVDEIETTLAGLRGRRAAAQELLIIADNALAQLEEPTMPGVHAGPTRDKRLAEKAIAECNENIAVTEQRLQGCKARLEQWERRRNEFDQDALRAKKELESLRRRVAGK